MRGCTSVRGTRIRGSAGQSASSDGQRVSPCVARSWERRAGKCGDLKALHVVALDGIYVAGPDGLPTFRPLGRLKTDEVADVLQIAKVRMLKALERRGMVRLTPEAPEVDDALAARDPVLAQFARVKPGFAWLSPSWEGLGTLPGFPSQYAWAKPGFAWLSPSWEGLGTLPGFPSQLTLYAGVLAAAAHWRPLIDMGTLGGFLDPPAMLRRPTGRRQSRPAPHAIIPPAPVLRQPGIRAPRGCRSWVDRQDQERARTRRPLRARDRGRSRRRFVVRAKDGHPCRRRHGGHLSRSGRAALVAVMQAAHFG